MKGTSQLHTMYTIRVPCALPEILHYVKLAPGDRTRALIDVFSDYYRDAVIRHQKIGNVYELRGGLIDRLVVCVAQSIGMEPGDIEVNWPALLRKHPRDVESMIEIVNKFVAICVVVDAQFELGKK